jgi:putative transposase
MSKKRTKYTSVFKTKRVLEVLQNEGTLVQIASKHNVLPQNLQNWKKTFLANAEIAMEPSKALKKYKDELIKAQSKLLYEPLRDSELIFWNLCSI